MFSAETMNVTHDRLAELWQRLVVLRERLQQAQQCYRDRACHRMERRAIDDHRLAMTGIDSYPVLRSAENSAPRL